MPIPVTHIRNISIGGHNVLTGISTSAADLTITDAQYRDTDVFEITTGHASHCLIMPTLRQGSLDYVVNNDISNAILVKRAGQSTPVTIAAGKSAILYCNGTDIKRLTPDA